MDATAADVHAFRSRGSAIGHGEDSVDRLLKAREIQHELGVSRATAYRLMTDGTLPTYRFGGAKGKRVMVRVSLRDLRLWLANHRGATQNLPAEF